MAIRALTGRAVGILLAAGLSLPRALPSQTTGDGFLFRRPTGTFAIRAGYDRAGAGSDVFSDVTEQLTLGRGAFSSVIGAVDFGAMLTDRLDLTLGGSFSGSRTRSEFRDWVDQDGLPIEQTTTFERVPVTVGLKVFLGSRGRSLGSLAWVPAKCAPYIGAGGGAMWYRFRQRGDFVDFQTLDIFRADISSSGWTATAHGFAGVEVAVGPRFLLVGEGRYTWARATMGEAFDGFERIDLSGLSVTAGIAFRM